MELHVSPLNGRIVSRAGEGKILLDNLPIGFGGSPGWLDARTVIYVGYKSGATSGHGAILSYDILAGGPPKEVYGFGANWLHAGGGRWASGTALGIHDSAGHLTRTGPGLLGVGPDGTLYYTLNYQQGLGIRANYLDGRDVEVLPQHDAHGAPLSTALSLHGFNGGCVWGGYGLRGFLWRPESGVLQLATVPGEPVWSPSLVTLDDGLDYITYLTDGRILCHDANDWRHGYVVATGDKTFYPHAVKWNQTIRVGYGVTQAAVPQVVVPNAFSHGNEPLYARVPALGRKAWCFFFNHKSPVPFSLPANSELVVDSDMVVRDSAGNKVAAYAAAEAIGTLSALEAEIARQKRHDVPVLYYWTRKFWGGPLPKGGDWMGPEAYQLTGESDAAFMQAIDTQIARVPISILISQCYTSNATLTRELTHLPSLYAKIALKRTSVLGFGVFSGYDRQTGYNDHPEAHAPWQDLFAGITGTPETEAVSAKATIESYETPITTDGTSRAVRKVTSGNPTHIRWQYDKGHGNWVTVATNPVSDDDHHYNSKNPPVNTFPGPGRYPIRIQTLVKVGSSYHVADTSSSTSRIVEVRLPGVPPVEPPEPPVEPQPPVPGPGQVVVHVTDSKTNAPIAGADTWSQMTPGTIVKTDANGYSLITASTSGVCAKKDGYHSPGLPAQIQTCKVLASVIELALEPIPPPIPPARRGVVRSQGHALIDDNGEFFALGGTAFWYLGGIVTEPERTIKNIDWWKANGADYLRNLCHASGSGANAYDPNFAQNLDRLTGTQYDHGLRSACTIFGQHNGTKDQRQQVVNIVKAHALAHPERFLNFEIVNEAYNNDFPVSEAREYAKQLLAALPHQVSVSAPKWTGCDESSTGSDGQDAYYGGLTPIGKVLVALHYARSTNGDSGLWDPVTQPWRGGDQWCLGGGERIHDQEGIGPTSSGNADNDPRRMATTLAVAIIGGGACRVQHVGQGVTGKVDPVRHRPANVWEEINIAAIMKASVAVRALFPPDAPNWTRGGSKDGPWSCDSLGAEHGTLDRLYCSWSGAEARGAGVNLRHDTKLTARQHVNTTVYDTFDGRVLQQVDLAKGQSFILKAVVQGVILKGVF